MLVEPTALVRDKRRLPWVSTDQRRRYWQATASPNPEKRALSSKQHQAVLGLVYLSAAVVKRYTALRIQN